MKPFSGVTTALVTPFINGKVDFDSLENLVKDQIKRGVQGFVVNGTTAESPTLTPAETKEIFELVKKKSPAKFPIIFGTGSNSTEKTINSSRAAEKMGADAILVVVPYYNKPPQSGMFEHFKSVADKVNIPVILYNVPSRTIVSLEIDTIKKLSKHPNIAGIKEATGNIQFAKQIREACGNEFTLLSGDDASYDQFVSAGGDGIISVASHIIPEVMLNVQASKHLDLINALFIESNPIPVKMALSMMKIIKSPELRLPLITLNSAFTMKLKTEMMKVGLI